MRYAGIIYNDIASAPGICLTFFTQGCPHHCSGCHNPETWSYDGGREFTQDTLTSIIRGLQANGIHRDLCIMGGEPLCPENLFLTQLVITEVKQQLPNTKVYIWTGYEYNDIKNNQSTVLQNIIQQTDCIIDGPYIEAERDISLFMRGSRNQKVIYLDKK